MSTSVQHSISLVREPENHMHAPDGGERPTAGAGQAHEAGSEGGVALGGRAALAQRLDQLQPGCFALRGLHRGPGCHQESEGVRHRPAEEWCVRMQHQTLTFTRCPQAFRFSSITTGVPSSQQAPVWVRNRPAGTRHIKMRGFTSCLDQLQPGLLALPGLHRGPGCHQKPNGVRQRPAGKRCVRMHYQSLTFTICPQACLLFLVSTEGVFSSQQVSEWVRHQPANTRYNRMQGLTSNLDQLQPGLLALLGLHRGARLLLGSQGGSDTGLQAQCASRCTAKL